MPQPALGPLARICLPHASRAPVPPPLPWSCLQRVLRFPPPRNREAGDADTLLASLFVPILGPTCVKKRARQRSRAPIFRGGHEVLLQRSSPGGISLKGGPFHGAPRASLGRGGRGGGGLPPSLSSPSAKARRQMTKDGFLMYLLSADGSAFSVAHRRVYQDMDQPLSHYLVSSSHNTYLLEDQLTGPSSTEAYIRWGGTPASGVPTGGTGVAPGEEEGGDRGSSRYPPAGRCAKAAAAWSWTAGTGPARSRSSTTAIPSPPRSSCATCSGPSETTPSRWA